MYDSIAMFSLGIRCGSHFRLGNIALLFVLLYTKHSHVDIFIFVWLIRNHSEAYTKFGLSDVYSYVVPNIIFSIL